MFPEDCAVRGAGFLSAPMGGDAAAGRDGGPPGMNRGRPGTGELHRLREP